MEQKHVFTIVYPSAGENYGIFSTLEMALKNLPEGVGAKSDDIWICKVELDGGLDYYMQYWETVEGDYSEMRKALERKEKNRGQTLKNKNENKR